MNEPRKHALTRTPQGAVCSECGRMWSHGQMLRESFPEEAGPCAYTPFYVEPAALQVALSQAADVVTPIDFEVDCLSTVSSKIAGKHGEGRGWFAHCAFKLAGEAGEFNEHVGKAMRDDGFDITDLATLSAERRLHLLKELGDVLWYVCILAGLLGSSLLGVMRLNVWKRRDRMKRLGTIGGSGDDR